jgi:hypothetical protein
MDKSLFGNEINISFFPKLRVNRENKEIDLDVKLQFHGLAISISHGDGYILVKSADKKLSISMIKCLQNLSISYINNLLFKRLDKFILRFKSFISTIFLKRIKSLKKIIF